MGSTTQKTTNSMDPLQQSVINYGFDLAKKYAETPFQAYTGQTVAGMTPYETQLLDQYKGLDLGSSAYKTAADVAAGIAQETPAQRAARLGQYSSEYTSGVIDPTLNLMERQRAVQRTGEAATRAKAGAWGSRGDVYQGALEGEYQSNMAKTIADLQQRGMDYATARATAEDQSRLGAASQLASTTGAGLQSALAGMGAQAQAFSLPRQLDQQGLEFLFNEFMRQQNLPLQQLGAIQGLGGMFPSGIGTTTEKKPVFPMLLETAGKVAAAYAGKPA